MAGRGYGPTGTLPRTFNPSTDDAFGTVFVVGLWDGSRGLVNTGNNSSAGYGVIGAWGDTTFAFAGGATQVGFSLEQMDAAITFTINGSTLVSSASIAGFVNNGARQGYLRIDVSGGSAPITSLLLDNAPGDGWLIDHMAVVGAVPEPGAWALMLGGLGSLGALVRRRRA